MVFITILGAIDVLGAISLAALALGYPLPHLQAVAALAILGKSVFFINDIVSIIDIAVAIAMFALLWMSAPPLAVALAVYLGIKGMLSFA